MNTLNQVCNTTAEFDKWWLNVGQHLQPQSMFIDDETLEDARQIACGVYNELTADKAALDQEHESELEAAQDAAEKAMESITLIRTVFKDDTLTNTEKLAEIRKLL